MLFISTLSYIRNVQNYTRIGADPHIIQVLMDEAGDDICLLGSKMQVMKMRLAVKSVRHIDRYYAGVLDAVIMRNEFVLVPTQQGMVLYQYTRTRQDTAGQRYRERKHMFQSFPLNVVFADEVEEKPKSDFIGETLRMAASVALVTAVSAVL